MAGDAPTAILGAASGTIPTPGLPSPRTDMGRTQANVDWITPAMVKETAKLLAEYIGPIAHILVERTASRCPDVEGLYAALSLEIESPQDRAKFLASRPKKRP